MKSKVVVFMITLVIGLMLSACSPQQTQSTPISTSTNAPTVTMPSATATIPLVIQESDPFPLSEPGPYYVGKLDYTIVDESRNDRQIELTIWYPALKKTTDEGRPITINAEPDMSEAPYPLILTGPNSGDLLFRAHLATYGFVMVTVRFPDYYDHPDFQVVDYPRDFLFALDQIASKPPEGFDGVIDSDHVGVTGYSGDGYVSLMLSGVRINPDFYLSFCEQASSRQPPLPLWYVDFWCVLAEKWDEFAIHAGKEVTNSDDELWQALTDERIRVVVPMAADGAQLFGERGLSMADRPMLLISPTNDEWVPYHIETATIFEHAGSSEVFLISFIGKTHMMVNETLEARRLKHFTTAFLGYHLQGKHEYRYYFSEEFVSQFDDLYWGVYPNE